MEAELTEEDRAQLHADRRLLARYRVMAYVTATLLIVLVFVGIPLQFAAGSPGVVNVVGTMHGFLYLVYLYVAFELTRRLGVPLWQMLLVLLAGTVPFCAIVAERKLTRRYQAALASSPAGRAEAERAVREAAAGGGAAEPGIAEPGIAEPGIAEPGIAEPGAGY